ncbi:MAG: hypothetical protein IPK19_08175 [Chloroflexi bacterium]|nr:hypothetical protein [Chloroflexota bacterium]
MMLLVLTMAFHATDARTLAQINDELILAASADVLFPQAICFAIQLEVTAADVAESELRIEVDGQADRIFDVDPRTAAMVFEEPEARLRTLWIFSAEDAPELNDTITYRWDIRLTDGRTAQVDGAITFEDPRESWVEVQGPAERFLIVMPRRYARSGIDFSALYDLFRANTSAEPAVQWWIYPPALEPGCQRIAQDNGADRLVATTANVDQTIDCDAEALRWVSQGWSVVQVPAEETLDVFVGKLMIDAFYGAGWEGKQVPDWFREALGRLYSSTTQSVLLTEARSAARQGRLLPLEAMAETQETPTWQAQSYGLLAWLIDRIGVLGIFRLANVVAGASDFATAFEQVTGQSLEGLIPAYEQWIFSREAEVAFGVSPFQAPTPAPTATNTPTETRSPTPVSTDSPSATPTAEIVPTRTTAPTATRLPSATPLAPSATPRPPGSLQTPTPVPVPREPSLLDQPNFRMVTLGVLLVLLIVLVALLLRSGRRR